MNFQERIHSSDDFGASMRRGSGLREVINCNNWWNVSCRSPVGFKASGIHTPGLLVEMVQGMQADAWDRLRQRHGRHTEKRFLDAVSSALRTKHYPTLLREGLTCFGERLQLSIPKWQDVYHNIVPNDGEDYIAKSAITGEVSADSTWFIGLLASGTPGESWTATTVGSNDFTNYSESTLQSFSSSAVSSGSTNNNSSPASFSIDTNGSTITGGFCISTNAKATPSGTLLSVGNFTGGSKSADDGDTLDVKLTLTIS